MLTSPLSFRVCPLVVALLFLWTFQSYGQTVQDCLGAIPVCQEIYVEDQAPIGNGDFFDFNSEDNCLLGESNSIWYTFTVNNSGQFGFLLTPNDPSQDYDWVLFDITNAGCQDLPNDPSLVVSCNAAGLGVCNGPTGPTGATGFSNQGPNCGGFPPSQDAGFSPFNDLIEVEAGNTYALCILNFSAESGKGYTLDFGLSDDIGIFDEIPPALEEAVYPGSCNGAELTVSFSEYIQCSTLSADNFQLNGTGGPYDITLSSGDCRAGGTFSKQFTLQLNPAVPFEGAMTLDLIVDGIAEAVDICGNPATSGSISFGGPTLTDSVDLGPDTVLCSGEILVLSSDLSGSYFWSDGSNNPRLEVSKSGVYWLTVNTACGATSDTVVVSFLETGLSDEILGNDTIICPAGSIELDATASDATYRWQDGSTGATLLVVEPGTYSVTVTNECGEVSDALVVTAAAPISAELRDSSLCGGAKFTYDVTTPGASYRWQDGSTGPTYEVTTPGEYGVTISTACDTVMFSATVLEGTGETTPVDLGADTTLCAGETLLLEVTAAADASIVWQDGSTGTTFLVDEPGTYSVRVTDECGEVSDALVVTAAAPISAELRDSSLCGGASFTYDVTTPGASYLWQDGSTGPTYEVTTPGEYGVTISTACDTAMLSATVGEGTGESTPVDLGSDTTLCAGETLLLEVTAAADASIVWQDGSTGAAFLVDEPGTYSVRVTDECGEVSDALIVTAAAPISAELRDSSLCGGASFTYEVTTPGASYRWQDGSTGPIYEVTTPGDYGVTISTACDTTMLSATVGEGTGESTPVELGADTTLCAGETLLLEVTAAADATIVWQDGSTGAAFLVDEPGTYSVRVTDECGEVSDALVVTAAAPISAELRDSSLCGGASFTYDVTTPGASYRWQDGSTGPIYEVTTPGDYGVTISTACDTTMLSATVGEGTGESTPVELGADTTLCAGETLLLEVTAAADATIVWQDGSTGAAFLVDEPGTYSVRVTDECGEVSDALVVTAAAPISAELRDSSLCGGASFTYEVTTPGASYRWQDGSTGPIYEVTTPGDYGVTISTACDTTMLSATVGEGTGESTPVDLGSDTTLCAGETLLLEVTAAADASIVWQDGSTGAAFLVDEPGTYSVTVTDECGSSSDEIFVQAVEALIPPVVRDTFVCPGRSIFLNIETTNADFYEWSDGTTDPLLEVEEAGRYSVLIGNACEEVALAIEVAACDQCQVYLPNAISPNGDGVNDLFEPYSSCVLENYVLRIFSRWGELVYETQQVEQGWDGTFRGQPAVNGIYVYTVEFSILENGQMREEKLSGGISVLR